MTSGVLILQVMLAAVALTVNVVDAAIQPARWCQTSCGNISIPFPFGTGPGCYLDDSFRITCNNTFMPPKPFLRDIFEVSNISLGGHIKVIMSGMAYDCYDDSGFETSHYSWQLSLKNLSISTAYNIFTAVGCDTYALVEGSQGRRYITACMSLCDQSYDVENGTCSGIGCCQTPIPEGVTDFKVTVNSRRNHSMVKDFNPCGYAFVAEKGYYNFSSTDLIDLRYKTNDSLPVVLDWTVGNLTCEEAKKDMSSYACQSKHSECHNSPTSSGYHCSCSLGFQGNPYLIDGCEDINECETSNTCVRICTNMPGSYSCSCPKGFGGDGQKGGTGCRRKQKTTIAIFLGLATSLGMLFLVSASFRSYKLLKRRREEKIKEKFFKRNGGLLLQKQLSTNENIIENTRIFTARECEKATDNFNDNRILGRGGQGTVYKGMLTDGKIIAIKRSKQVDESQLELFINEVLLLSQVVHKNVVKLHGCCLETEVPLLVYEFIPNGTLYDLIHDENDEFLTWNIRLRIATEIVDALAYLHSAILTPIYHRDIKSSNILLDEKYTAKVSDFGTSMFNASDKTHITTLIKGTFGYLDPEYFQSSQFTEKSDVYSFGVVLVELLTRKKAISTVRVGENRNLSLATCFLESMEGNRLDTILDAQILDDNNAEEIIAVARLAQLCLNLNRKRRPNMKEVAIELERIKLMKTNHNGLSNFQCLRCIKEESVELFDAHSTWTIESSSRRSSSDIHPLLFNSL